MGMAMLGKALLMVLFTMQNMATMRMTIFRFCFGGLISRPPETNHLRQEMEDVTVEKLYGFSGSSSSQDTIVL